MPGDAIITVEHLTKAYRIWENPSARLKSPLVEAAGSLFPRTSAPHAALARKAAGYYRDFHALNDVSFTIRRGEATGIIGRNGSGKSTLLQIITGTLQPTSGRVTVHGRVSALLELGSGFNPDFTGRENVYLNGSILGFSAKEMDERFASITAFAEIGDFIDEPVKTYSSGMMMRLAFAVAVNVQPDVLIVDEALSVGDVFFTQKCFERIREILAAGATLIFVSHDMASVQNLCNRGLLLNGGRLIHDGLPEECVTRYFSLNAGRKAAAPLVAAGGLHPKVRAEDRAEVVAHDVLAQARSRHGDRALEIVAASASNEVGAYSFSVEMMRTLTLRLLLRANAAIGRPAIGLQVFDRRSNLVFAAGTPQRLFHLPALSPGEELILDFTLTCTLAPGEYTLGLDAATIDTSDANAGAFHDRVTGLGPLVVHYERSDVLPFYGAAQLPLEIAYA